MFRLKAAAFALALSTGAYAQTDPPIVEPVPVVAPASIADNPGEIIKTPPSPINQANLAKVILEADKIFDTNPNARVVIKLPAGRFDITGKHNSNGSIELNGITPGATGRLIIRGAGIDATTLVQDHDLAGIFSHSPSKHITIENLHLTTPKMKVTQGWITKISGNTIWLRVPPGFPTPTSLWESRTFGVGKYLREATNSNTSPQFIPGEGQVPYTAVVQEGDLFKVTLGRDAPSTWTVGDLLAYKSKNGGSAYFIMGAEDWVFNNVRWSGETRGVFRGGPKHLRFTNVEIRRPLPINGVQPILTSPAGGPQINQPSDTRGSDVVFDHFMAEGTGDDAVAFFNMGTSVVKNSTIKNSFARGININNSDVTTNDDVLINAPLLRH